MSTEHRNIDVAPDPTAAELEERVGFEALLADISARLLNLPPEAVDGEINEALRRLGGFLRVERSSVSSVEPSTGLLVVTHNWAAAGTPQLPPRIGEAELPWVAAQIRAGLPVILSRFEELPEEAVRDRETARSLGVRSAALLPLSAGGRLLGTVEFSTVAREVSWPTSIVQRLRLIGEIFASVLLRRESDVELRRALARVRELTERLEAENAYLRQDALDPVVRGDIVGDSAALRGVLLRVEQVAPTDATVLILGETGVGKELVAKAIHERSTRRGAPLVSVNCAALPANLIESELFGHEKGAFTGAVGRKFGRFELADGGTIFLDEVGELPLELQAKLLRVLQSGEIERLGAHATQRLDVRVVAATNRDLKAATAAGTFRSDLYYRLAVFPIEVPPLRARREDVAPLALSFLAQFSAALGRPVPQLGAAAKERLAAYHWPGNIRELRNVMERAAILSKGGVLILDDAFDGPHGGGPAPSVERTLEEVERNHIVAVLGACGWRIRGRGQAAERLGLNPSALDSRMEKLGIRRPT